MKDVQGSERKLTEGSVWKHMLSMAIPAMFGYFFHSIYHWTDTFWAGKLSTDALAALSTTFPLFLFGVALAHCVSVGTMVMVSNSLGEGSEKNAQEYLEQSVGAACYTGLLTAAFFWIFGRRGMMLLGARDLVLEHGMDYITTLSFGMPFMVLSTSLQSGLTSRGNTVFVRNIYILNALINFGLDPLLMYGVKIGGVRLIPAMGIGGIALATDLIMVMGATLIFLKLRAGKHLRTDTLRRYSLRIKQTLRIMYYGMPVSVQVGLVSVGLAVVNSFLYRLGSSNAVAGYGIGLRVEQLALIPSFGAGIALSALVGQNNGAQKFERVFETYKCALIIAGIVLVVAMFPLAFFGKYVARIFTNDPDVIATTSGYLWFALGAFYAYQLKSLSASTLQGMKMPLISIFAELVRQLVFPWIFIPIFAYWLKFGYWGAFISVIVSVWIPALFLCVVVVTRVKKKLKEQQMHNPDTALLIIDVQNDFLPPSGALKVFRADEIIEGINNRSRCYQTVIATKDFHPRGHVSFASSHGARVGEMLQVEGKEQMMWPDHCVQGSNGAELAPTLKKEGMSDIIEKGTQKEIDSYSAFFDNGGENATKLHALLSKKKILNLHICGLATDYCVKYTVLDALRLGYAVQCILPLCRAVNAELHDEKKAIEDMKRAGAQIEY